MRSRTSRGVSEWSGGKELYIGSAILAIGTSFGVIGIVPGPPEGSRGSTCPGGATWAIGGAPWPVWAKGTSPKGPCAKKTWRGKSPKRGRHLRGALGRMDSSPLWPHPFLGGRGKAAPSPPLMRLYKGRGGRGGRIHKPWRPLLPATPPPPPVVA